MMKKLLFLLLSLLALNISAQETSQEFSTINFVANHCMKNANFAIYLNEKLAGSVMQGENLEYKIYSEGRISVIIIVNSLRITSTIDIKRGNTYYFELNYAGGHWSSNVIDEKEGKEIYAKNLKTIKAEEDKGNPIAKLPETKEDGPKQGTCFLISKQGYFLTNYHVISGAKNVQVKGIGNDFTTLYGVDVVAFDVDLDLALLKLKNQNITFQDVPYVINTGATAPQGTKAFVLGYPLSNSMGEEIKVSEGIISAKSGYKGSISQYQFSAAVQPGNSGSPLFNDNGDVIGIVDAKLEGAEGAGYAIKSQYIATFLKLIDAIQLENSTTTTSELSLPEKIALLKNNIFIVKTE